MTLPLKKTVIGMVTREDKTFEGISQELSKPLLNNNCYSLTLFISRDSNYISATPASPTNPISFNKPVQLYIYGSNKYCGFAELLSKTPAIYQDNWVKFDLTLITSNTWKYINIYAFPAGSKSYNGHILIDGLSNLKGKHVNWK